MRIPRFARPNTSRGLTLIELMVGLAILAVVSAMAAPSFQQWGRNTRVTNQANELHGALAYARSESFRRGTRVTVCSTTAPDAASPACSTTGSWADGWIVFIDNSHLAGNTAGVVDGTDTVLRITDATTGITISSTGNLGNWVSYTPQTLARTAGGPANGSFALCNAPFGRQVVVSAVGVIRVTSGAC